MPYYPIKQVIPYERSKAMEELGFQPTSIRAAMQDADAFHYRRNA